MMTSLIMSIFSKIMQKMTKIFFSLKLTLWQLEKIFSGLLSTFESQDSINIEHILVNMLMFLKNPIKSW